MELDIKGDPGNGNRYDDVHIDKVENYNPGARTMVNNQGTTINISLNFSLSIDGQKIFNLFRYVCTSIHTVLSHSVSGGFPHYLSSLSSGFHATCPVGESDSGNLSNPVQKRSRLH